MTCCMTPSQVDEAFLASQPYIANEILDLTIKSPNWMGSLWAMEEWPRGVGSMMEQIVFKGAMPQIERDFDKWKKQGNLQGCDPCAPPDCSYNWTMFGGHGLERKVTSLMNRDFRTPDYCVNEIQNTAHFKEMFGAVVNNIHRQTDFFKEMNIGQNFLTMLAKKYVVDSDGAKPNVANPYVYRPVGTAELAALNIEMLEFFYEQLRRMPNAIPYDVIDGSPIYALEASSQLLSRLYRDDSKLREDVRFSGLANDALMKYNFMSTIRGMYIAAPILYPRRFTLTAVTGEPVEVLPFINGVPAEVGSYTDINPMYEMATHEEILIHGKWPFKVFFEPTEQTLGGNTSFGPEFSFMNSWLWINPLTQSDPFRRVGYFATSAKIGLSQQFSDGIFGILVARPSVRLMAQWNPVPVCPPAMPDCDNSVPAGVCPCPLIGSVTADPFTAGTYVFTFYTSPDVAAEDPIQIQLDNGAYITGEVVQVSTDGLTVSVSFTTDPGADLGCHVVGIFCDTGLGCSATVVNACDCRSNQTGHVELTLSNAIKAIDADDDILVYFGDCTQALLTVVSVDASTLTWVVEYGTGYGPTDDPTGEGDTILSADMICDRGGISKVCVPPATDASCPACGLTVAACDAELLV